MPNLLKKFIFILFLSSLWIIQVDAQQYFSEVDAKTKYVGSHNCLGGIIRWQNGGNNFSVLKFKARSKDTLIYTIHFNDLLSDLLNAKINYIDDDPRSGLILKAYSNSIYLSYPREWFVNESEFPPPLKLIDFNSKEGEKVRGENYFFYKSFDCEFRGKRYNQDLVDTVYQYKIVGFDNNMGLARINGFLFSRKFGFIRWDYSLEDRKENKCTGYLVSRRIKNSWMLTN